MKSGGIILGLLGLGAAVAIIGYKKVAAQVSIEFVNSQFKLRNLLNSSAVIKLRIINPALKSVDLKSLTGDLISGSAKIGTFNFLSGVVIPARGETTVEIPVTLNNLDSAGVLLKAFVSKTLPEATINGTLNFSAGSVPFMKTFKPTIG